jgi:hypothetical protein
MDSSRDRPANIVQQRNRQRKLDLARNGHHLQAKANSANRTVIGLERGIPGNEPKCRSTARQAARERRSDPQ